MSDLNCVVTLEWNHVFDSLVHIASTEFSLDRDGNSFNTLNDWLDLCIKSINFFLISCWKLLFGPQDIFGSNRRLLRKKLANSLTV